MFIEADPQMSEAERITSLKECFTAEPIFNLEFLLGLSALYRILRDYLVIKGYEYVSQPSSSRIVKCLDNCFMDDKNDKLHPLSTTDSLGNLTSTYYGESICITQITDNSRSKMKMSRNLPMIYPNVSKKKTVSPVN